MKSSRIIENRPKTQNMNCQQYQSRKIPMKKNIESYDDFINLNYENYQVKQNSTMNLGQSLSDVFLNSVKNQDQQYVIAKPDNYFSLFSQIIPEKVHENLGYSTARTKLKSKLAISMPDLQKKMLENQFNQQFQTYNETRKSCLFSCKSQQSVNKKKNKTVEKVQPCVRLQRPKTSRVKSPKSMILDHKPALACSQDISKSQKTVKLWNDSVTLKKDQRIVKKYVSDQNLNKQGKLSKKTSLMTLDSENKQKQIIKNQTKSTKSDSKSKITKRGSSANVTSKPQSRHNSKHLIENAAVKQKQIVRNPESEQNKKYQIQNINNNLKGSSTIKKLEQKAPVVLPFQNITKKIQNRYNIKAISTGKPDQKYDITSSPGSGFSTSMNILSESKGSFDSIMMSITSSDSINPASLMPSQKQIHTFFSKNFLRDYNNSKEVIRQGVNQQNNSVSRNHNIVLHQENIKYVDTQFHIMQEQTQTQDKNTVPSSRRETESNMHSDQKYQQLTLINQGMQQFQAYPSSRNSKCDHSFRNTRSKDQSFTTSQEQGSSRIEYNDGQSRSKIYEEIMVPIHIQAPSARITNSPSCYDRSQRSTVEKNTTESNEPQSLQDFKQIEQKIYESIDFIEQQTTEEGKAFDDIDYLDYNDIQLQTARSKESNQKAEQGSEVKADKFVDLHAEHYQQTFNTMDNLDLLKPYSEFYRKIDKVFLPDPNPSVVRKWQKGLKNIVKSKVLMLDIDETMIHCIDDRDPSGMIGETRLRIGLCSPKTRLQAEINGQDPKLEYIDIDINVRPGLLDCLQNLKESYQIVSFTASDQLYADAILDYLDPNGDIFSYRLYRQHCVETEYGLIKDLRIIANRNLKDMVIIDNSALSFSLNVNNGIPILPFYDNKQDEELKHLGFYLNCLQESNVEDVRIHNEEAFNLYKLVDSNSQEKKKKVINQHSQQAQNYEDSILHNSSQDYLQCDPIEFSEEQVLRQNNRCLTFENQQCGQIETPINYLSLLDTNQIIEERSNEDGGLSSRQISPDKVNQSNPSKNCSPLSTSSAFELQDPVTLNTNHSQRYNNKGKYDDSSQSTSNKKESNLVRKQKSLETITMISLMSTKKGASKKPDDSIKGSKGSVSPGKNSKGVNKMAQSQKLELPTQQLDELSIANDLTIAKFDELFKERDEVVQRSVQVPGEIAKLQGRMNSQIEEKGFTMIQSIFDKIGGQHAVMSFMEKRYPSLYKEPEPSMRERSDEGGSLKSNSMRQRSVVGQTPQGSIGVQVKSQVTNLDRPAHSETGLIQPFDQVMSNFAMYGLANRNQLSGKVDTSPASQVAMMQELSGLCLKIYRSVNLRFQRIAQMMLSGNTDELKEIITTNFFYKMTSHQSLVLTRISENCLMVDEPQKKIGIIDERALHKQFELNCPDNLGLRSSLQVRDYIFTGYSNGILQRHDSETLESTMTINLHTHVFSIALLDDHHIICGQMNGWIDVVRIEDGVVVLSKELKHIAGNITIINLTGKDHEVMLGTQRGVYFAHIGKGLGLMEVEMERFDKQSQSKFGKKFIVDEEQKSLRIPQPSERAEQSIAGPKHNDLDGMSQMTFHSQSQFGREKDQEVEDRSSQMSNTNTVFTKPFTVQSNKSDKNKLQQSVVSKAGTEIGGKKGTVIKQKDRLKSNIPEKSEGHGSEEVLGTVAQTENPSARSNSKNKTNAQSQQVSILKKSLKQPSVSKRTDEVAESQDGVVMKSQNSIQLSNRLKHVTHAEEVSDKKSTKKASRIGKDSEIPSETVDLDETERMDVQERESNSAGSNQNQALVEDLDADDEEMRFVLSAERYLIGHDIRGMAHLEGDRYGIVAWNDDKVYSIDREKPDAVIQFNMPHGEKNSISMRLIPFYHPNQFPFAIVLCQTSICCIDFKRYNSFKICPWKYKGVPNNVNQLEMHLSKEDDQVGEQINIVTLEFDGSNSFVRRLVLDHDCIQALNFLGQD